MSRIKFDEKCQETEDQLEKAIQIIETTNEFFPKTYMLSWSQRISQIDPKLSALHLRTTYLIPESLLIEPNRTNLWEFARLVQAMSPLTMQYNSPLRDYISLTRAVFDPFLKMSCDWCSIVNGYIKYLRDAFHSVRKAYPERIRALEQRLAPELKYWTSTIQKAANYIQFMRKKGIFTIDYAISQEVPVDQQIPTNTQGLFEFYLETAYLNLEIIESRWCPFNYMAHLAKLPRSHAMFMDASYQNAMHMGALLNASKERIECQDCVVLSNKHLASIYPSFKEQDFCNFGPYVNVLDTLSQQTEKCSIKASDTLWSKIMYTMLYLDEVCCH